MSREGRSRTRRNTITKFKRNQRGAALVEYGILVGLVAVVAIGSVTSLGQKVDQTFRDVGANLASVTGAAIAVEADDPGPSFAQCETGIPAALIPEPGEELCGGYFTATYAGSAIILSDIVTGGMLSFNQTIPITNAHEGNGYSDWEHPSAANPHISSLSSYPDSPARAALGDGWIWANAGNDTIAWRVNLSTGNYETVGRTQALASGVALRYVPIITE